jgi:hypothetical protein
VQIWKSIINTKKKIKVGIRWSGSPLFEHQQFRLFPPENLIDLHKDFDHIQFYSLQRDTDTRELTFIENRYKMFYKVHYDDSTDDMDVVLNLDTAKLAGSMVKVIVHEKNNPYWFDMFIDKIEKAGVLDLQVVEDNLNLNLEDDSDIIDEAEDTLTILRKYTEQFGDKIDKSKLDNFLSSLYQEALSLE